MLVTSQDKLNAQRVMIPAAGMDSVGASRSVSQAGAEACYHCGTVCVGEGWGVGEKRFCCLGCRTVYELLTESGMGGYYALAAVPGVRVGAGEGEPGYAFLDVPEVRARLVDYSDERVTRVTWRVPAMHCVACVWLLENLFRLREGLGKSRVNFARREVSIAFETGRLKLSEVAGLLKSLGYEPDLKMADLDGRRPGTDRRRLWLQVGVAGFAFGNTMLFGLASYLGLDGETGARVGRLAGYLSLGLAVPVMVFSAADYWKAAWASVRSRVLTIDVPIAAGLLAIFAESVREVVLGRGVGYLDSLAGLIFFLLCGRLFQRKVYERLSFDRDYRAFFPLSANRLTSAGGEQPVALSELREGDRLVVRHGDLVPADSVVVRGEGAVDYSYVTGESAVVMKATGDTVHAGGRQMGGLMEVEVTRRVTESYLASLWEHAAFAKQTGETLDTLTNRYSRRFTILVAGVAVGAALVWGAVDASRALQAFTSVLIVACPCALALAAPVALGTAQRVLARQGVYLKRAGLVETLACVDTLVMDKTGTLTSTEAGAVEREALRLSDADRARVAVLAGQSAHPHARRLARELGAGDSGRAAAVTGFVEEAGAGIRGWVEGRVVVVGSLGWLRTNGVTVDDCGREAERGYGMPEGVRSWMGSVVHVGVDGEYRGRWILAHRLVSGVREFAGRVASRYELGLVSGDHPSERERFAAVFGPQAEMRFRQSPLDKLEYVRGRQEAGRCVMMVGDGLNDAGALRQADVGVAVAVEAGGFSPASDVIVRAGRVVALDAVLEFSRWVVRVIGWSFALSAAYNVVGVTIAARGELSPLVCAILMPLSSATVVAFAAGLTWWGGRRLFAKWARGEAGGGEAA